MKRELVMGVNAVSGLVETSPERIVRVWIKRSGKRLEELAAQLKKAGVSVEWADERALDRACRWCTPPGRHCRIPAARADR